MHPSTQQNSGLKTVHEYFKDFDEQHRLPYDKAVLETSRGHPYSFREQYREKVLFLPPPLSRHRGFRFPAVQHTPCLFRLQKQCFKPVNGPPKIFQDAMDPFTKQGNCPRTLIRKSPYTKALPVLGSQCPDLISGATFSEPSLPQSHSFISTKLCF
ncbi:hypothetical protein TNCT_361601 [Trichonephila clavata]|uniref:Uncharacterized protein n=1 Tax=Trichonephila clavata TaxID=2740835 RepID=A0A8X6GHH0_TRICU|nr:hypothetical protein TNCT_361601 [Trichonephila clavata]